MAITTQDRTTRRGYKQTAVGVIPLEWSAESISNLASITTGKRNTQDKVEDGAFPFFVRSQTVERINSYSFDGEAVLTAGDGVGTGKVFHYIKGKFDFHQRVYKISDFRDDVDGFYFYLYFSSHFYDRIMSMTAKSSVDSVRLEMIADMQIPVPPVPEQRAIAAAVADVDVVIASLDELIAKKRDIKTAAMQQLLSGRRRLPGFRGDWVTKLLGDVAGIVMGQSPRSAFYNTRGVGLPLIQGNADIADRRTVARIFTTEITKRCSAGDLIMSVRAPVGYISKAVFEACLGRGVCAIRYPNDYLYHYLIGREAGWARLSKGSTFDSVNSADVKALEIYLPSDEDEQTAIAAVLSDMDNDLASLEARRDKTKALKQGMLQQLLTGHIRLI